MAWMQPKTDWKSGDSFDLFPDYARIKNNLRELQAMLLPLGGGETMPRLKEYSVEDVPGAAFYNDVEQSVEALNGAVYRDPLVPPARVLRENTAAWDAADLNRIEGSIALLKTRAAAAQGGRYALPVRLGKGRR